MKEENKSVKNFPNLRFPGFEGEWEIRYLGDFIDVISGIALKSDEIIEFEKGTPILRGINITEGFIRHNKEIDRFYPKTLNEKTEKFILKINDLVIGMDGSKVGKNVALIDEKNIGSILIQRVARIRALNSANINFIFQKIFSSEFIKYVDLVNTSSGIPHISLQQIKDFKTSFPLNILEQEKIASFLSLLDSRIQTQKKIIEQLETLMKASRENIFSQKLRFKNENECFYSEWKSTKLKNITQIFDGTHQTPEYVKKGIPFYSVENVTANNFSNTKCISEEVFIKENNRVKIERGDILMTRIGDIGTVKHINWDVKASFYVSLALIKKGNNHNSQYLAQYISSEKFQNELWNRTIHVAFPKKINLGEIGECLLQIPCMEEQTKIANFLFSIQEKIETEKQILEKLELQKKFLLANLFV